MEPMFLPGVEANPKPSAWATAIESMQKPGREYPQIWHLFAFQPSATDHLARFTQAIMREDAPLTPGLRELIAAYTSSRNECPF
jgi:alkylhydroperoxidase family enzyme